METKVIYPGSFDPFTNGHLDIVLKASKIFDRVLIVVADNPYKRRHYTAQWMRKHINEVFENRQLSNCMAYSCDGLVADFAKSVGAKYIIRGLRNSVDFEYEESLANAYKLIYPELDYIYLRAESVGISSSMVRELIKYGKDVSEFVPIEIAKQF